MTIDEYRGNKELIAEINKVSRQNIGLMKINKIFKQQNADLVVALEDAPLVPMALNYHNWDRIDDWFAKYNTWRNDVLAKAGK